MLVEDSPDDVTLTLRAFDNCDASCTDGWSLDVVNDGEEAIEYLSTQRLPKLILLDLNLPRIDGFEVLKYICSHERTKAIPVIVLTSSAEEQDIKRAYHLGANSYICKPINFNRFYEVTKELSFYWLMLNESPV